MALRLKNTSQIAKIFGVTAVGAFANNAAIKNNPQIIQLLLNKQANRKPKRKYSSFEKSYYKRLIESSEKIKAERQGVVVKRATALTADVINDNTKESIVAGPDIVNVSQENKSQNANKIDDQIAAQNHADKKSKAIEQLPNLYWESSVGTYYHVSVERNLFGSYSLIKSWGGIKNKLGGHKITFHETLESINQEIKAVSKERAHKKYNLITEFK